MHRHISKKIWPKTHEKMFTMGRYLVITREIQRETTMRKTSHPLGWLFFNKQTKQKRTSVGKIGEELEPLCMASRNDVKWSSCHRKWYGDSSKN